MKKDENRSGFFETSDLPLATTLLALGFTLDHLNTSNPYRVVFFFVSTDSLQAAIGSFWIGKLAVEPKTFWNIQRELKARIRNETQVIP